MNELSNDLLSESRATELLIEQARETFGSDEKARRWLRRPTTVFAGSSPLAVASSGAEGVQKVADLLKRIDHGLAV